MTILIMETSRVALRDLILNREVKMFKVNNNNIRIMS